MNKFRVDRAIQPVVPCGMNSILYVGDNGRFAHDAFDQAQAGLDVWAQPNAAYGVILSVWDDQRHDWIIKRRKGLQP